LIQFGEPQAQQYGVDWNNPAGSQLGPDGAIARYYRSNGWQPGMGMLDAYSIVNAGAPGRYSASDANNGGAPGDVRDKVENQMAGHRAAAMRLLGMEGGHSAGMPSQNALAAPQGQPQQPSQNALAQHPQAPQIAMMDVNAFMRPQGGFTPQAIQYQRRA
jgi:hypothetical protein